jgi:GTPase
MKFRVKEGSGEAYYRIGVEDNGKPTGLEKADMF